MGKYSRVKLSVMLNAIMTTTPAQVKTVRATMSFTNSRNSFETTIYHIVNLKMVVLIRVVFFST